jgi:hypothetical protein
MIRSLKKAFEKIDLSGAKRALDSFNQTLLEGHYGADKRSVWSFFFKNKGDESDAPPVVAGNKLFQMSSKTLSSKYVWPPLIAILSVQLQMVTIVALGVLGAGLLSYEYNRCRRMRLELITEVNVAGQTVRGTRADLYRLHRAQASILNLSSSFRPASIETTRDTINDILRTVDAERRRVRVIDGGHYGAAGDQYHFSRQLLGLVMVHEDAATAPDLQPVHPDAGAAPLHALKPGNLAASFRAPAARLSPEEVLERLVALENALPDDLRDRFRRKLAAQPRPPAAMPVPAAAA